MERLIVSAVVGAMTLVLLHGMVDFDEMLRMDVSLNLLMGLVFAIIVSFVTFSNLKK